MINVYIPSDSEFTHYEEECKNLYKKLQKQINDKNSFEFIKNNTYFYAFTKDKELIGSIYYFLDEENKLYLNGFAKRKKHNLCLQCLKMSLNWFKGRIYAEAQNRASALCLLRCGFKRIKDNIFGINKN